MLDPSAPAPMLRFCPLGTPVGSGLLVGVDVGVVVGSGEVVGSGVCGVQLPSETFIPLFAPAVAATTDGTQVAASSGNAYGIDTDVVDVVAPVGTSKRRTGLHVHVATPAQRSLIDDPLVRAVGVADACVLTAAVSGVEAGVVAMDAAVHRRLTSATELGAALDACSVRYGAGQVRAAIGAVDPACESP